MHKKYPQILGIIFIFAFLSFFPAPVFAGDLEEGDSQSTEASETETEVDQAPGGANAGTPVQASYKGRCQLIEELKKNPDSSSVYDKYPSCANSPNECSSDEKGIHPLNCLFLTEAIGGKTGYDLYKKVKKENATGASTTTGSEEEHDPCKLNIYDTGDNDENNALIEADKKACEELKAKEAVEEKEEIVEDGEDQGGDDADSEDASEGGDESAKGADVMGATGPTYHYELWYGEYLVPGLEQGPYQAILLYEPGKDYQGPLALLYNYLGLAYNYISGFILGIAILIAIIGGIEMITSSGNSEQFGKGQKHIINALIGMVIWFLASVILYTINPTFFRF